jgi:hypothetical protein
MLFFIKALEIRCIRFERFSRKPSIPRTIRNAAFGALWHFESVSG